MKTFDLIQGSPQWYEIRRGRPTASQFKRIITPKKAEFGAERLSYQAELIAESLGWQSGFHGTPDTQRGNYLEKEAIRYLQLKRGIEGREIGFCMSDCGRYGASPDWLTNDNEPTEVKAPDLHTFVKWHQHWRKTGQIPDDHKSQCHGELHVTGADRGIFIAYSDHPALPKLIIDFRRDAFTAKLAEYVERFCDELDAIRSDVLGDEAELYLPTIPTLTQP